MDRTRRVVVRRGILAENANRIEVEFLGKRAKSFVGQYDPDGSIGVGYPARLAATVPRVLNLAGGLAMTQAIADLHVLDRRKGEVEGDWRQAKATVASDQPRR